MTAPERVALAPGYEITRLIHGGWQFSAGHRLDADGVEAAIEVLMESAELGVTTFDCADIYTGVEDLFGRFLERWRTTSVASPLRVHTKFVPDYHALPDVDRAYVERIVHRSLQRLGVERLDLVQFYWWRDEVPGMEEAARCLGDLCAAGTIRHLAVTNMDAERVMAVRAAAGVDVVADQVQYSLLDRRPEHGLSDFARGQGVGLLCFGTLAGGFLTDRWLGAEPPSDAANRSLVKYRLIIDEFGGWPAYQALLRTLREIADSHGLDIATVALRFVLDQPGARAVIVGATRPGQMRRNLHVFDCSLSQADHAKIREHLDAAPGPLGPVFGLERDRDGPHGRIMKYDLNAQAP